MKIRLWIAILSTGLLMGEVPPSAQNLSQETVSQNHTLVARSRGRGRRIGTGALGGAAFGGLVGGRRGALIGGGLGAGAGALHHRRHRRRRFR